MIRRTLLALLLAAGFVALLPQTSRAQAPSDQAYGRRWGQRFSNRDYERFYHYPYVYYPQNFWGNEYYRSANNLYYRYPPEMRVPVYNRQWFNYYPEQRKFHRGHHFILDQF